MVKFGGMESNHHRGVTVDTAVPRNVVNLEPASRAEVEQFLGQTQDEQYPVCLQFAGDGGVFYRDPSEN